MHTKEKIHYEKVLESLNEKKRKIEDKITSLRAEARKLELGIDALNSTMKPRKSQEPALLLEYAEVKDSRYANVSIADAAKDFLGRVKAPQKTRQIIKALEDGGVQHRSANFYATVFAILLRRAEKKGDIKKVDGKWALTEWYSNK